MVSSPLIFFHLCACANPCVRGSFVTWQAHQAASTSPRPPAGLRIEILPGPTVLLLQLPHPPGLPAAFAERPLLFFLTHCPPHELRGQVLECSRAQRLLHSAAEHLFTRKKACLLQGSCSTFSRIKIQEGSGNIVKSNALPIHCSSRASS